MNQPHADGTPEPSEAETSGPAPSTPEASAEPEASSAPEEAQAAGEPSSEAPAPSEPTLADELPIPPWAFCLIFMLSPLLMAWFATLLQFRHELESSPLATGLVIGHAVSAIALFAFFMWRRSRQV